MADSDPDGALAELYRGPPVEFTATRKRLAAAAKKRGDTDAAKEIAAARKPTTSAWVVNQLVYGDGAARDRLADLGERLRNAHAAMDGEQIRALSGEQRRLVEELTRTALRVSGVENASAALRDDVIATLQAAVADPDVTARLGRLAKAEQWSGFGEFGEIAQVSHTPARRREPESPAPEPEPAAAAPEPGPKVDEHRAERERRERARAALAEAERAKADADDVLTERQSDLATARLKRDDARNRLARAQEALRSAEEALDDAEQAYAAAKEVSREAGAAVREARKRR